MKRRIWLKQADIHIPESIVVLQANMYRRREEKLGYLNGTSTQVFGVVYVHRT
jgi:hypothetical protein